VKRLAPLAILFYAFPVFSFAAFAQAAKPKPPASAAQDALVKKDAEAESELEKAISRAGNDRAALVRNLKDYLARYPDAPRKAGVYRALVESCQQLKDDACALDYAERLIAIEPDDSEMMLLAVGLLQQQGDDDGLRRATGYVTRVIDRVEKAPPEEKPARESLADWQARQTGLRAVLYYLRGQIEDTQRDYAGAIKDLETSYSVQASAPAAELLGEIDELKRQPTQAIEEYALAFVLPDDSAVGKVDRREVRQKLGNVWRQLHPTDQGLGEMILSTYDRLSAPARASDPAARNRNAKDAFDFVLRKLDGTDDALAAFRGKTVVLSFWATWCGPCRVLEPMLIQVAQSYAGNAQVNFLAVDTDEDQSQVAAFVAQEKWKIPVAYADGLDDFLKVETLPTVIIFGRDGKIIYRANGLDEDTFQATLISAIQQALAGAN
jgi:thiol-disulfide isomerase/thioredoxin